MRYRVFFRTHADILGKVFTWNPTPGIYMEMMANGKRAELNRQGYWAVVLLERDPTPVTFEVDGQTPPTRSDGQYF